MIKYALFDFDGTLIDSNEIVITCLHKAAEKYRGFAFSAEELEDILGKPLEVQMGHLTDQPQMRAELVTYYRTIYRERRDEMTREFEGIMEMLESLKLKGIKMGIVSNKGRSGIAHGIEKFGLSPYILSAVSSDDVVNRKPDPEGIFKALEALGGTPEETVFVGDSGHDLECGINAGCSTILVGWTVLDIERLKTLGPSFIAETPKDIVRYIESSNRQ